MDDLDVFEVGRSRLALLLDHLGTIPDTRAPWRVRFSLSEVLFLIVCGSVCDCDDYESIAAWGKAHLEQLRRYLPYDHGTPCGRWLCIMLNRMPPALFEGAFRDWVKAAWPQHHGLIAIDGKISRGSCENGRLQDALHLVTAFATTSGLILAQEEVPDKANECRVIPILLERLGRDKGLEGAMITIDAIATNKIIAKAVLAQGADWLLPIKANQPSLMADLKYFFAKPIPELIEVHSEWDKGHGRIEHRQTSVSRHVDWIIGPKKEDQGGRLPGIQTIICVRASREIKGKTCADARYYVTSADLTAKDAHHIVRGHWAIENSLHWVLDVTFKEDQCRTRIGHGAINMALVRRFSLNLIRTAKDKSSLKLRRKRAGWDPNYLANLLGVTLH
jgi:predicted transposase YbfD/YdcC